MSRESKLKRRGADLKSEWGDPAAANNAPADGATPAYCWRRAQLRRATGKVPFQPTRPYPPPPQGGYDQGGYNAPEYAQGGYGDNADEQPIYAPEPPPEMPQYEQPYCPGDDYIWTSGYWYWTQSLEVLK